MINMKKSLPYLVGAGAVLYLTLNKPIREKGIKMIKNWLHLIQDSKTFPIEEAGVPELDNIENAKMVDEGSQFGVEYYNRVKD